MIRKTMRVGEIRTSIKLEGEFWSYLKEVADGRRLRLSGLVNEVAEATPDRTNLASTLRTFSLMHAKLRCQTLERELDRLALAGNTQDLTRVLEACPLPSLILDAERGIRQLNRAFALWLNLDPRATLGKRLEHILVVRGAGLDAMWRGLLSGQLARGRIEAAYVSPTAVCSAQAVVVARGVGEPAGRGFIVLFDRLSDRTALPAPAPSLARANGRPAVRIAGETPEPEPLAPPAGYWEGHGRAGAAGAPHER
jgi:predicted DNA-binding ribbon-helix-helix protein